MPNSIYYSDYQVTSKDCSIRQTLKLSSLLEYLQESAWHNATHLGFSTLDLMKNNITWVMNRMKINIHRMPGHNEKFTIETWPSGMNKYYTQRDFRIWGANKEVLVEATSNWLVMDIKERKLISIPDDIKEARFVVDRGNIEPAKEKIKFDDTKVEKTLPVEVSWFDLDLNEHVNNTEFYKWLLDALGGDFLNKNELKEIDVVFKYEGKYGDRFDSKCYFDADQNRYYHSLIHQDTLQNHVVARTRFEPS